MCTFNSKHGKARAFGVEVTQEIGQLSYPSLLPPLPLVLLFVLYCLELLLHFLESVLSIFKLTFQHTRRKHYILGCLHALLE